MTLDTMRPDRMGFLGSPRGATPQLDFLAKEGVVSPLGKAIELQPENPVAHYEMGLRRFEAGDGKTWAGPREIVVSRISARARARAQQLRRPGAS